MTYPGPGDPPVVRRLRGPYHGRHVTADGPLGTCPMIDPQRRPALRRLRLGVFALALVGALAGLGSVAIHLTTDPLIDFHAYYHAAARLNAGQTLYLPEANPFYPDFYRYPPLLAIVLRPLALLPYETAALIWGLFIVVLAALTLVRLGVRRADTWLALGILGLPIGWAVSIGQGQVIVTLLLAIGAPWSVAVAAQLKLVPALAAIYWLGRRDWRNLGRFVIASAVLVGVQLVLAPRETVAFLGFIGLSQVGNVLSISPYVVSPLLWAGLVIGGTVGTLLLARTRWGWPAAIALSTLAAPRLLVYMLGSLWAAVRSPDERTRSSGTGSSRTG